MSAWKHGEVRSMNEPGPGAVQLAELMHRIYEELAPAFGYQTRTETRDLDLTSPNGRLMVAVCDRILTWLDEQLPQAAQAMVDSYQPHVMEERCRACNVAWQRLREALGERGKRG